MPCGRSEAFRQSRSQLLRVKGYIMRGGHSATRIVVWLILVYHTQLLALVYSPILTNIKMTNLLYPHIISQQFIKK